VPELQPRRIKVLRDSVARKIAAGEVIDRPQAVLRELLDNGLDSGASRLEVRWVAGGLQSLEVTDNGQGMDRQDLELCWLPHTTSKIETEDDLETLTSLGFRGEALASIAACSRLTIVTCATETGPAHRLTVEDGHSPVLKGQPGVRGTRVLVEDLFASIPARRKFLKSASAEANLCRRVLDEKALGAPEVGFTLWADGVRRQDYPAQPEAQRVLAVLGSPWQADRLLSWSAQGEGFRLRGYALRPPESRGDRKGIRIYANRRPLQEFALVQALCYAFEGYLPGGAYPHAVLFLEVDPSLVDFNIHPAKREARFRNLPAIHQKVVESLRAALEGEKLRFPGEPPTPPAQEPLAFDGPLRSAGSGPAAPVFRGRGQFPSVSAWDAGIFDRPLEVRESAAATDSFRYLGQVLGVFLVAEVGDDLYLVDQHAAHERILFDAFRDHGGKIQELLFPRRFTPEDEVLPLLESQWERYSTLGIGLHPVGQGEFELTSLPQTVAGLEKTVIDFVRTNTKPVTDLEKDLYASLSCRAAVMDGDPLDPEAARSLLRKAFALEHARCPHGRPIWTILSRRELFEKVGRLV
jgi:DNA mismatch repair protein MutL